MVTQITHFEELILLKIRELPEEKKAEILDFIDFLRGSKEKREGEEYSYYLITLRKKIGEKGGLGLGERKEEILQRLRRDREEVWKENYEDHFR